MSWLEDEVHLLVHHSGQGGFLHRGHTSILLFHKSIVMKSNVLCLISISALIVQGIWCVYTSNWDKLVHLDVLIILWTVNDSWSYFVLLHPFVLHFALTSACYISALFFSGLIIPHWHKSLKLPSTGAVNWFTLSNQRWEGANVPQALWLTVVQ